VSGVTTVGAGPQLARADAVAFRLDGVEFRWAEVLVDARRRGEWQILETEARQALACERLVTEQERPLAREAERSVAVAFRRSRRLYAAEDLEAWLAARDLTVAEWRRYVRGQALRRRHIAELDVVVERHPADDEAVLEAFAIWGRCSGAFSGWAEQLAARAAAAHAICERDGLAPPGPGDLEALEGLHDRFAAEVATEARLTALLAARYLDWLRIDGQTAAFADRDTAAEALLCVRDDGWSLAEATQAGSGRLRRRRLLVEELDAGVRHHFVRARAGDLLGPLPLGERMTLVHVLHKDPPSLDDAELRIEATRALVATAAAREVDDRVEWLHPR
jgi:hypothetical protein